MFISFWERAWKTICFFLSFRKEEKERLTDLYNEILSNISFTEQIYSVMHHGQIVICGPLFYLLVIYQQIYYLTTALLYMLRFEFIDTRIKCKFIGWIIYCLLEVQSKLEMEYDISEIPIQIEGVDISSSSPGPSGATGKSQESDEPDDSEGNFLLLF